MADLKGKEKELKETLEREREEIKKMYADVQKRLKSESDRIQKDIRKEYRQARKYVKKNPETGVGAALAGGFLLGLVIAKLLKR